MKDKERLASLIQLYVKGTIDWMELLDAASEEGFTADDVDNEIKFLYGTG